MSPILPDGWSIEEIRAGQAVLKMPAGDMGGAVTIDWERRGFLAGYSTTGRLVSTDGYTGRGWKERLVADAVAWLQCVYAARKGATP